MGLGLGAAFLMFGMADRAADHADGRELAHAAVSGYTGAPSEPSDSGAGFRIHGLTFGVDASEDAIPNPSRSTPSQARRSELECLTSAVYYEARGESPRGQAAVAQVVLNRVRHPSFPTSVCAVVYQGAGRKGCQFSFACDGSARRVREPLAWDRARDVATKALAGLAHADIGAATHFHTTAVSPVWAPQMLRVANVGTHVFYKFAPYRLARASSAPSAVDRPVLTAATGVPALDLVVLNSIETAIEASLEAKPSQRAPVRPADVQPVVAKAIASKSGAPQGVATQAAPQTAVPVVAPKAVDAKPGEATREPKVRAIAPQPPLTPASAATEEARLTSPRPAGSGAT